MRILVISNTPWSNDNSFGNSFSNIFNGIPNLEFANISLRKVNSLDSIVSSCFEISENSLIKNLKNSSSPSGKKISVDELSPSDSSPNDEIKQFARRKRWIPFFWIRDMIWKMGRWKSQELLNFIDEFRPDLIFQPIYYSSYINDIACFVKKYTGVPMIGYISDDNYTLKQFSLSPLYWIDRLYKRRKVRKTFNNCETVYVISETQRREYAEIFGDKFEILTKCADFDSEKKPDFKESGSVLKLTYAGNVSHGRYLILSALVKAVEELNKSKKKFMLDIYTATPLSDGQKLNLTKEGSSNVHPPVSYAEILEIQKNSDILVHAEAFSLKEKLAAHQSFSTKIVDYLAMNRCILAIGDESCASIQYFLDNECGAVVTNENGIKSELDKLYNDKSLLRSYAENAWETGKKNHQRKQIQESLYNDLIKYIN